MSDALEITRIAISPLSPDEITPAMAQHELEWFRLEVSVQNMSDTPLYVISQIRRIRYDAEQRRLRLEFSDDGPTFTHDASPERRALSPPLPPQYTVVEPGANVTLTNRLTSPIHRIEKSLEGANHVLQIRLEEDVETIECFVAYSVDPPPPINLTATEPRRSPQLASTSGMTSLR
jgi:hypothetical protein